MPRIPLIEDLTTGPVPSGSNLLVEFDPNSERECAYCGNDAIAVIIAHPDGEVICGICGTVLGRMNRSLPIGPPAQVIEEWSGSRDDVERILEENVSKCDW